MAFQAEIEDFGAFYERGYQMAYRLALGIVHDAALAADVTQDAYATAFARRDRFRGEAPGQAWLHRIVVNAALTSLRRRRPIVREVAMSEVARPDENQGTSDRLALFAALDRLPPRQRAAIILRYYHDYDYASIAQILGTSATNVGAMLSRALDRLKDELGSEPAVLAAAGR